ncbi:MAG: penicillin-binding protein, partial [Roseburia sp.]|nr:penicillin-binding protein [Roseburia sp.]
MNYGKKGAKKRTAELTSKSTVIKKKLHVTFFKALLLLFFVVVILGGSTAFGVWKGIIDSAPSIDELDATPTGYQTIVLDDEGNKISTLVASGSNRKYVTIDQIPQDLQDAFVALEDMRFYEHNGIDLKGIVRAAVNGVKNGFNFNQGASTITQQLLKNTVLSEVWAGEESFIDKVVRKVQEQYMAIELEKQVDKLWILENYLNAINLGQNTLGVAVASERYFGKPVSELTLSESAVIAAITQNPSKLNPISNPEKNAERREKTLKDMLAQGYITQEEYDVAIADDVYERIQIINIETGETVVNSYFIDELTDQVITDLIEQKGYTESQAYKALYQGGLTIKSTQNMAMQAICDEEVNNLANYPTDPKVSFSYRLSIQKADGSIKHYSEQSMLSYYQKIKGKNYNINFASQEAAQEAIDQYKADIMEEGDEILGGGETVTFTLQPQVALTIIDQTTGEVKAIIGGRGDKTASKTLNRASDVARQPGSTFKIIACYAAALDAGGLTLASVQNDAPFAYSGEEARLVSNYDNRYRGWTTLREAIISSLNVVTVKTYTQISPRLGHSYAVDFGFSTIRSDEADNQSFCLGGMTNGVSNLE